MQQRTGAHRISQQRPLLVKMGMHRQKSARRCTSGVEFTQRCQPAGPQQQRQDSSSWLTDQSYPFDGSSLLSSIRIADRLLLII
jgi:hypothetical protein